MDYRVAANIYAKPWLIEGQAALGYIELLERVKAGTAPFEKKPSSHLKFFQASSEVITAPIDKWSAREHPGYEGKSIAILPVMGPLMKEDFCGTFGTVSLRNELDKMNAAESVKTIVLLFATPGGTVAGTQVFADAVKASPKETIGIIEDMCGSAGYWIASGCDRLMATADTDIIGSIGTMIQLVDQSAYLEEQGIVKRTYVADASKDKNLMFDEALKGSGKLLIEDLLNPLNDLFVAAVKANRGEKLNEKETLSGKIFLAQQALEYGLIDEIASFQTTVNSLLQKHKNTNSFSMKFPKLMAFLGLDAKSETVVMNDEQLQKTESAVAELETVKAELAVATARATELETAAAASATEITGLKAQVATLTTEKTALTAKVQELGKLDAKSFTTTTGGKDPDRSDEGSAEGMAFQKALNDKL